MDFTGENIIGYHLSCRGSSTFQAINPSTGEQMAPPFYEADAEEVDTAVEKAEKAFDFFRAKHPRERAGFLDAIAAAIETIQERLIARAHQETALPEPRLRNELGRTVSQLRLFANLVREGWWVEARIDPALPDRQPLPRPDIRRMLVPLGPVGIFGAGNFPLAFSVAGGDTVSALAAGCPVVFKAHPAHPGTSALVGNAVISAAKDTGMPDGIFSLLHGPSPAVGLGIATHYRIRAIGFTGSFQGGKALFDAAMQREEPIPVYAEMGSTNPVFFLPGAVKENGHRLAEEFFASVTLGVGQFCTNPGISFFVQSEDTDRFITALAQRFAHSRPEPMLTGDIKRSYEAGVGSLLLLPGVDIAAQGSDSTTDFEGSPALLRTTVETLFDYPEISEEVFGPSTVAVTAQNRDKMLQAARWLTGHLTASIHGTAADLDSFADLVTILERKVGRLIFNEFPTGVDVCHAMHHGGPFPATTDAGCTSVGTAAIRRFARPVCYQSAPAHFLPQELRDENPLRIWRLVNGTWRNDAL